MREQPMETILRPAARGHWARGQRAHDASALAQLDPLMRPTPWPAPESNSFAGSRQLPCTRLTVMHAAMMGVTNSRAYDQQLKRVAPRAASRHPRPQPRPTSELLAQPCTVATSYSRGQQGCYGYGTFPYDHRARYGHTETPTTIATSASTTRQKNFPNLLLLGFLPILTCNPRPQRPREKGEEPRIDQEEEREIPSDPRSGGGKELWTSLSASGTFYNVKVRTEGDEDQIS
ncbi:hypothetical protein Dimus_018536 [Dionaea muscipula]